MPHYPHMMAEDIAVWSKYLAAPVAPIKEVWYDVHVGGAVSVSAEPEDILSRVAAGVTRKRIDCIARVGGGYWVIEIKPFGGYVALGQVQLYHSMFIEEFRPDGEAYPVIICGKADPDLVPRFDLLGVVCIEVD